MLSDSCLAAGRVSLSVVLERVGRALRRFERFAQQLSEVLAVPLEQIVGRAHRPLERGEACARLAQGRLQLGQRGLDLRRGVGDIARSSRSVFLRMPAIEAWFSSDSIIVIRSVRVASRSSSSGALARISPRPPGFAEICGLPSRQAVFSQVISGLPVFAPLELDLRGAGKARLDRRRGVPSRIGTSAARP